MPGFVKKWSADAWLYEGSGQQMPGFMKEVMKEVVSRCLELGRTER